MAGGRYVSAFAGDVQRTGSDEQDVKAEEGERLRRAVSCLAEPERSVVLAYYLGEMSVTEIARALNMPEGTVKTRLHRGRQALRKELMVP